MSEKPAALKNTEPPEICILKVTLDLEKANKMILGKLNESWWTGDYSNPSGTSCLLGYTLKSTVPLMWPSVLFWSVLSKFYDWKISVLETPQSQAN